MSISNMIPVLGQKKAKIKVNAGGGLGSHPLSGHAGHSRKVEEVELGRRKGALID